MWFAGCLVPKAASRHVAELWPYVSRGIGRHHVRTLRGTQSHTRARYEMRTRKSGRGISFILVFEHCKTCVVTPEVVIVDVVLLQAGVCVAVPLA